MLGAVGNANLAQPPDSVGLVHRTTQALQKLEATTAKANAQLTATTTKALDKLNRQQEKVYKHLRKIDSLAAADWLAQGRGIADKPARTTRSDRVKAGLQNATNLAGPYLPRMDSLQTMLGFLNLPGTALQ
ncbi:MAG: hypothetical protein EAY75_15350, partial [Bacteroidetes bacterium]